MGAACRRAPRNWRGPGQAGWGRPPGKADLATARWAPAHGAPGPCNKQLRTRAACLRWPSRPDPPFADGQLRLAAGAAAAVFPSEALERLPAGSGRPPTRRAMSAGACQKHGQNHGPGTLPPWQLIRHARLGPATAGPRQPWQPLPNGAAGPWARGARYGPLTPRAG